MLLQLLPLRFQSIYTMKTKPRLTLPVTQTFAEIKHALVLTDIPNLCLDRFQLVDPDVDIVEEIIN